MQTNFKEYLEKKKVQKKIDSIAKKYSGKKIVIYGAGIFANELFKNYDFSNLDILGVADIKFQDDNEGEYYGYKKIGTYDLLEIDFDLLLLAVYDDEPIKDFLQDDLLEGEDVKFKIETLIKMSLWDYIRQILKD